LTLYPGSAELTYQEKSYVFPEADVKTGKDGKLWVAGYEWTGSEWQVILPGTEFPWLPEKLEELPIFSMADIQNGNFLAWYEEVFDQTNAKDRFTGAIPVDKWKRYKNTFTFPDDLNGDGKLDTLAYSMILAQDLSNMHYKRDASSRFSTSFVNVPDAGIVVGVNDLLNANGTFVHFPTAFDPVSFNLRKDGPLLAFLSGYNVPVTISNPEMFLAIVESYGPEANIDALDGISTLTLLRTGSPMAEENERIVQGTIDGDGNFGPGKVGTHVWGFLITWYE